MKRVLVLGAGQVGTFAARAIAEEGISVVTADLKPELSYFARFGPREGGKLVTVNILDSAAIGTLLKACSVDAIVLSAALTGEACARDIQKGWEVNVDGVKIVAQAALDRGIKRLVFISSFAVYGRPAIDRISETVPVQPQSEYGRTKAAAESVLTHFRDDGLDVRILRPCGIYGPRRSGMGSHSARLIDSILFYALNVREFTIKASQTFADEYLYVKDLGRAIMLAAVREIDSSEFVFNVGIGWKSTVQDLCLAIQRVVPSARVTIEAVDINQSLPIAPLDVSRIRSTFGFEPHYGLVEGLSNYLFHELKKQSNEYDQHQTCIHSQECQ